MIHDKAFLHPDDAGPMVPAAVPDDVQATLFSACSGVAQLVAASLNAFPLSARRAVLQALSAGTPLDVNFRLQPDGSFAVSSTMGDVPLFTINTATPRERGN